METAKSLGRPLITRYLQEEEFPGLHGPFAIPERILQKIWLRKDFFLNKLISYSKKRIQIIDPGRWNQFEGPDFKDAELVIDGQKVIGDVEIHFHPNNWFDHRHNQNPDFSNVVLHVTLFEPTSQQPVFTTHGFCPETLVLLPYLKQGLEEYALDDALLSFENRGNNEFIQSILDKPIFDIKQILIQKAQLRWQQKYTFAHSRIKNDGFEHSCHQMALEVLGYRRNRTPMSAISINYPLHFMVDHSPSIQELIHSQEGNWKFAKLRPANHPQIRLQQYLDLVKKRPDWPTQWNNFITKFTNTNPQFLDTVHFRKEIHLSKLQSSIKKEILAETISGTRFHTLMTDALLPLASAQTNKNLFDMWFHWHPGDIPSSISTFLNPADVLNKDQPLCNGFLQGILQLFIESRFI